MNENQTMPADESVGILPQSQPKPTRRILVLDHNSDICRLRAEALKSSGYDVDTADDGQTGWNALHAVSYSPNAFNLLITNHDMPGLSGLALVKKLRVASMALPVIIATGTLTAEELFARYPWLHPAIPLPKHHTVTELLGTVRQALRATARVSEGIAPHPNRGDEGKFRQPSAPV